jgi:mono/diheme cytochrome c family protein
VTRESTNSSQFMLLAALFAAIGLTACSRSGASAEQIARGKDIFDTSCAPCHVSNSVPLPTQPPNLDGLFKKSTLPSGAPATDAQVRKTITEGRGVMPPFGPVIHDEDLDALIAYLHTR